MDEDILTLMEALTTQANDTDPDPGVAASAGVALPIHTPPPEDALSTTYHEVKLEQKSIHKKMAEETREMFRFSSCLSADVPHPCTEVAPGASSRTNGGGNGEKKSSRKRRNRKKCQVFLSWPVTLQIQASSTNPFPCQASAMGAFFSNKEQRRKKEKEKTVLFAHFWQDSAGILLPEASPVQPSLEGISVEAKKERNAQKRHYCKRKAKKNQIKSSPWPVTVQAWASFVSPDPLETGFTESLLAADDEIKDDVSVLSLSKGTQVNTPGSPAPLAQASWEEMAPDANAKRMIKKKKKHEGWQGKEDNAPDHTWPLEIQAWAPFQAAAAADDPVQTLREDMPLQWECWPLLKSEKQSKSFDPWSEGTEEGSVSGIAPLQISLKDSPAVESRQSKTAKAKRNPDTGEKQLQDSKALDLESYQSWGNAEKSQGGQDGDDWEYSILDLGTQAECYPGDLFSQEECKASTFAGSDAYTSVSESEIERQEAEDEKTTFQTLWMGKWGGF